MLSKLLTRREQSVIAIAAMSIIAGSVALIFAPSSSNSATPIPDADPVEAPDPTPTPAPVQTPEPAIQAPAPKITIAVRGAVRAPGLFEMPADSRVDDAISRAGGATEEANLADINVAALLVDNSTLTIPRAPVEEVVNGRRIQQPGELAADLNPSFYTISGFDIAPAPSTLHSAPTDGKIDLNLADGPTLESLPGIGPVLAAEIMAFRESSPFNRVDDLIEVKGIGPKKLEALRPLVVVRNLNP